MHLEGPDWLTRWSPQCHLRSSTSVVYPPHPGSENSAPDCLCLFARLRRALLAGTQPQTLETLPQLGRMPHKWTGHFAVMLPLVATIAPTAPADATMSAFARICCSLALAQLMQPCGAADSATCAASLAQIFDDAVNKANHEVSALYTLNTL